jgi:hypothetical protein
MMSRSKTRPVVLTPAERNALTRLVRTGSHLAQQVRRARILLELDEGDPDRDGPVPLQAVVAERAGVHAPARPAERSMTTRPSRCAPIVIPKPTCKSRVMSCSATKRTARR